MYCVPDHVYVSGTITSNGSIEDNIKRFYVAEDKLYAQGYVVYNPARLHMDAWTQEQYMDYYLTCIMPTCDAVYMLTGWEHSKGACIEHEYALAHGLHVIYEGR